MTRWICASLFVLAAILMTFDFAEARRLGGGRSFGSKGSYSKSYQKPTPPSNTTAERQAAATQPSNAAAGGPKSRFGGIGGMLGGLLVGGMLGSLLFGGAGGGFGVLEILLLGVAGFMLFRFLRSRNAAREGLATRMGPSASADGERLAYAAAPAGGSAPGKSADGWASVRSTPGGLGGSTDIAPPVLPASIDEAEFLAGAKALYIRLQTSWDRRDLDDIREFTSPEFFAEISRQADEDPAPGKTDILMVEARVIEVSEQGTRTVVSVLYDALLREDQSDPGSKQTREVWHIRRDESAAGSQWTLEGIQQLER